MKKKLLILMLVIIIATVLYLPHNHTAVVNRIHGDSFKKLSIVQEIEIDDKTAITLYLNQHGLLDCAISQKALLFYRLEKLSGHLNIENSHNLKQGDLRVQLHVTWYDKAKKYVVYGCIIDDDVATVTYQERELVEISYNGARIVYGFGLDTTPENSGEYKLYNADGVELEMWKDCF